MKRGFWCHGLVAVLLWSAVSATAYADVFSDVPEAKRFKLLYTLQIPLKGGYASKLPAYQTNNAGTLQGPFSRVAYYLTLQPKNGKRQFVYVSMDAFSQNPKHLGVPSGVNKVSFQQNVKRMNVVSNVPGITNGVALKTGNLEFWHTNYGVANSAKVPRASDTTYDHGDQPSTSGTYGSMQIHNHGPGQTLLAYNGWGSSTRTCEVGIGNNTVKASTGVVHKDWTFRVNCASFTTRTLQVLVQLGETSLTHPLPRQVIQRQRNNKARVRVAGITRTLSDSIEARVVALKGGKTSPWKTIVSQPSKLAFEGFLEVDAGWYTLQVRTRKGGQVSTPSEVTPFGVGEVFVIAGQSNSANSGKPRLAAKDPRVTNYGDGRWVPAQDPMLIATGGGGSPWPVLGDLLVGLWDVPIGILSVGWGGTSVLQWQPGNAKKLYPRLKTALDAVGKNGARAILWHQGESDSAGKTSTSNYARLLNNVIAQSRKDAGWTIPWYIAGVAYLPRATAAAQKAIRLAQDQVVASHPQNFAGPTTDDLIGSKWRHDNVHFNEAGLREHARRWSVVLRFPPCSPYPQRGDQCPKEPMPEPSLEPAPEPSFEPAPEPGLEPAVDTNADRDAGAEPPQPDNSAPVDAPPADKSVDAGSQDSTPRDPGGSANDQRSSGTDRGALDLGRGGGRSGCGCQQGGGAPPWLWWSLLVLCGLVGRRRDNLR